MENADFMRIKEITPCPPINYRMVPHLTTITGKVTGSDRDKNATDRFNKWVSDESVINPEIVNVTIRDNLMIIVVAHYIPVINEEE